MGWMSEAPKRALAVVEPSTVEYEGRIFPALAFAFGGTSEKEVTATFVAPSEKELRQFQRDLDRAITNTIRALRARSEPNVP